MRCAFKSLHYYPATVGWIGRGKVGGREYIYEATAIVRARGQDIKK